MLRLGGSSFCCRSLARGYSFITHGSEPAPDGYNVYAKEGKAFLIRPTSESKAFYNPAMETNRDLSVAMAHSYYQYATHHQRTQKSVLDHNGKHILNQLNLEMIRV
jgi:tRNA G26 N,N-dimethylase Trm1